MSDIPSGWPCAALPSVPPSVLDLEAQPTPDGLLPQILALTPRGPAWGTDETGDGSGASPVQRQFWRALAAWAADHLGLDWTAATQTFPTAISYTLDDWERELGLPDACNTGQGGTAARLVAVRSKFASQGGQSPAFMICLAQSLGYTVTIEEPDQFAVDTSALAEDSLMSTPQGVQVRPLDPLTAARLVPLCDEVAWKYWVVHVAALGETFFKIDEGVLSEDSMVGGQLTGVPGQGDPLEGLITPADLMCVLDRVCPTHTVLVFRLDL